MVVAISLGMVPGAFAFDWMPRALTGAPKPADVSKAHKDKQDGIDAKANAAKAAQEKSVAANRAFIKADNEKIAVKKHKRARGVAVPQVGPPKFPPKNVRNKKSKKVPQ